MVKPNKESYIDSSHKTGKVITPAHIKTDIITDTGEVKTSAYDSNGESVNVQNPFPEDDGTVYAYQVNPKYSSLVGFDGEVVDLFFDYHKNNFAKSVTTGGVNPKSITIHLYRPVFSSVVAVGSPNTSLSNGVLILRGIDGKVLDVVDFSDDDTKRGVVFFEFEQAGFIEAEIQFHTDDEVTIAGAAIIESKYVTIGAISGLIPAGAQTNTPMIADEEWISEIIDTKNYVWIIASATSNVASAVNGYVIEFSTDRVNWYWQSSYTVGAGKAKTFSDQPVARWLRTRYKNGIAGQGYFDLTTQLKPVASKSSSHKINDPIDGEDDAELVKAINTAFSEVTGESENITSFRRALQVDNALVHRAGVNSLFTKIGAISTTLAVQASAGATDIDVVSSAAFNIGDQVILNSELFHFHITDIVANNVQLDRPIDSLLPIGTVMQDISNNMAVVGSLVAPVSFKVAPPTDPPEIWQLTRIIPGMIDGSAMDDGKFGGIPALINGAVLRAFRNGQFRTGAVWKTNGDMALDMFNLEYTDKAPAGENGMRGRWTFTNAEFVVELDGATGDYAEILIQDDGSANTGFFIKAQGRIFGA